VKTLNQILKFYGIRKLREAKSRRDPYRTTISFSTPEGLLERSMVFIFGMGIIIYFIKLRGIDMCYGLGHAYSKI